MKRIIFTFINVFIFSSLAFSQNIPSSAEKRIELLTRVMSTELQLNEATYIKLKALNRERVLKSDEAEEMYSGDQSIKEAKLTAIEGDFENKFAGLLNPVQLAAYKNYRQETDSRLTALKTEDAETKNGTPVKTPSKK